MKKSLSVLIASAALVLGLSSCQEGGKIVTVSAKVTVNATIDYDIAAPESYDVVVKNTATGQEYTAKTVNSECTVKDLLPGVYSVSATATVVDKAVTYIISGNVPSASVLADGTAITVDVKASKESALILKEVYTTGVTCSDEEYDTYFRDQFYEIYNNSNQTVYADGLCFGIANNWNYDFSVKYQWPAPDGNEYVAIENIWTIPGSGKDYPIKSGESIVLAQWGTDHTVEKLSKGKSPMNLSGADFEFIEKEREISWAGITITDGPAVNMKWTINSRGFDSPQFLTPVSGSGYVLFLPSTPLDKTKIMVAENDPYAKAYPVLVSDVLDACERVGDETRLQSLQLPVSLNTAPTVFGATGYTCQTMYRKISSTRPDGTVIYQDTNDTSKDFEVSDAPVIRRNNAGVPSWNTWNK